jgi:hypothetical protein
VSVALDWSDALSPAFAEAVTTYVHRTGIIVPAQPWVFAGWVAAQGNWLDYNATHRPATALGGSEVQATLAKLQRVATRMDALLRALRLVAPTANGGSSG